MRLLAIDHVDGNESEILVKARIAETKFSSGFRSLATKDDVILRIRIEQRLSGLADERKALEQRSALIGGQGLEGGGVL